MSVRTPILAVVMETTEYVSILEEVTIVNVKMAITKTTTITHICASVSRKCSLLRKYIYYDYVLYKTYMYSIYMYIQRM